MPDPSDDRALRARFEAELTTADLSLEGEDRERLFTLWAAALPFRAALRAAPIDPDEEPACVEQPTRTGGDL